jgi:integrase
VKLIKRNIEALSAPKQTRIVFDEELPGFGLRITPAGKKTFVVQYRVGGGRAGRQRRVTVGAFGKITPEDARTEAKKILARAHLGDDFADQRDKTRNSRTVSELIDEWSKGGALINRRTGTRRQQVNINNDIALANHHLKPLIGNRTLDSLSKGDIQQLRNRIAGGDTKTTRKGRLRGKIKVTGGEGTATRTIRLFSSILSYAVDMELIERNPALGIRLPPSGQRHRYLTPDELRRLGEILEQPAASATAGTAATILRLLLLTGARRGEIEGLKWSEVDFNFGMLRKKTSKTGAKVIPLARVAVEILEEQRRWVDRSQLWVFPAARGDAHFDGLNKEWFRIRKLAGIEDVHIHDLRHTFASVGAGGGVGLPLIGGILGHRQASTTQRYAHLADGPLRTAADLIGSELAAALAGASSR